MSQPSSQVHTTVTGADGKQSGPVVHNPGVNAMSPSAGVAATISKGAAGQVVSVHGTVAGVVIDSGK